MYVCEFDSALTCSMDFLKSAVASAISKGPPFPYSFGEVVPVDDGSIWTLYNGVKRVSLHRHLPKVLTDWTRL